MGLGVKRPLEAEDFSEISLKQPKQIDYNEKLVLYREDIPSQTATPKIDFPGIDDFHLDENFKNGNVDSVSLTGNKLDLRKEEAENREPAVLPYPDFNVPVKPPTHFVDPYARLLNSYPKNDIPIGPDYQANIPKWDPNSCVRDRSVLHSTFSDPNNSIENKELRLMGTCIIPMPCFDDSSINKLGVGCGRTDCTCADKGSIRCAQQHVKETREELKHALGEEIFTKLGFYEMGEEVASRWTPESEQTFHDVIYSNPAKQGGDFWEELSTVFSNRLRKDIVSYYFNVFMLRKRAVQNRSRMLQIDSDDDEDRDGDYHQNDSVSHSQESDDDDDDCDDEGLMDSHANKICLPWEEDPNAVYHLPEPLNDRDLDLGWANVIGAGLVNGDVGHEEKGRDSHVNGDLDKDIMDHNDVIDGRVTTVDENDCNENVGKKTVK